MVVSSTSASPPPSILFMSVLNSTCGRRLNIVKNSAAEIQRLRSRDVTANMEVVDYANRGGGVFSSTPTASARGPISDKDVILATDDITSADVVVSDQAGDNPDEVRKAIRSLERTVHRYRRLLTRVMQQTKSADARGNFGTGNGKLTKPGAKAPNENFTRRTDKV